MNKEFKRMIKLAGLTEIKIHRPTPLGKLQNLKSKINSATSEKEKISLAIQCTKEVLFIFEEKYPNDDRLRKAIEAAEIYLTNPTDLNKSILIQADNAAEDAQDDISYDQELDYVENGEQSYLPTASTFVSHAINAASGVTLYKNNIKYLTTYIADNTIDAIKKYYN
jgi:hypothetical protein